MQFLWVCSMCSPKMQAKLYVYCTHRPTKKKWTSAIWTWCKWPVRRASWMCRFKPIHVMNRSKHQCGHIVNQIYNYYADILYTRYTQNCELWIVRVVCSIVRLFFVVHNCAMIASEMLCHCSISVAMCIKSNRADNNNGIEGPKTCRRQVLWSIRAA